MFTLNLPSNASKMSAMRYAQMALPSIAFGGVSITAYTKVSPPAVTTRSLIACSSSKWKGIAPGRLQFSRVFRNDVQRSPNGYGPPLSFLHTRPEI